MRGNKVGHSRYKTLNRLMSSTPAVMAARMMTILNTRMPIDQLDRKLEATLLLDNKTLQGYENLLSPAKRLHHTRQYLNGFRVNGEN